MLRSSKIMFGLYHAVPRSVSVLHCWLCRHLAPVIVDHDGVVSRCPTICQVVTSSNRGEYPSSRLRVKSGIPQGSIFCFSVTYMIL
ncbi:hypothetical protein J6590_060770 [Homalodisca vitripennis]|nr:hypothetical protein J6590_060770 [Homalodisca vitripennis]